MMNRALIAVASLVAALATASGALAGGYTYAGPKQWSPGQSAGSSFSKSWLANYFSTWGSGYDKTVTFIDNQSYGWHNTLRNRNQTTETYAPYPLTVKGHCVAHDYFSGSCSVR
jgi:hypothetical protein